MTSPSEPYRPPSDPTAPSSSAPGWSGGGYGPAPAAGEWGGQTDRWTGPQQTETKAVVALVLAIASFVFFPFLPAVAALFVARGARREIAGSGGRLGGSGLVTAARITAWVNIVLSLLGVLFFVVVVVLFGVGLAVSP